jgi:hypothetical protein
MRKAQDYISTDPLGVSHAAIPDDLCDRTDAEHERGLFGDGRGVAALSDVPAARR